MTAKPQLRGAETRDALVDAAIEIFGRDGFHAASTRSITSAAGVNLALISFHFGGKVGLYEAALGRVAAEISVRMEPVLEAADAQLSGVSGESATASEQRQRYLPLIHQITDALVAILSSPESHSWARLLMREQQDPSEGFDALFAHSMGKILSTLTRIVARSVGPGVEKRQVRLLVITIVGQALVFRYASGSALKYLGSRQLRSKDMLDIQATIRRNVTAMLQAAIDGE